MTTEAENHIQNTAQTKEMTLVHTSPEQQDTNFLNTVLYSNLFNFIIVVFFIFWVIKKANLAGLLAKKQAEISEMIKNAVDEKKIKQNHFFVTQSKVANIKQETDKIIDEGNQVACNISESIRIDAEKQAEDMNKKASASLENEKQLVLSEVSAKITGAAFYVAEEHIKQSIDDRLHKKFIDEFINNLDVIHN